MVFSFVQPLNMLVVLVRAAALKPDRSSSVRELQFWNI